MELSVFEKHMENCINHTGATSDGYGVKRQRGKIVRAHRIAYCVANGVDLESISGKVVMHLCDNRLCINPAHLQLGTHAENCADKVSKGRQAKGSSIGVSKLTEDQVKNIKAMINSGMNNVEIASIFDVQPMTISKIRNNKTWSHV